MQIGSRAMCRRRLAPLFGFRPRVALAVGSQTESIRETDKSGRGREQTSERTRGREKRDG